MALDDFRKVRIEKLKHLRDAGVDPYPIRTGRTHRVVDVLNTFEELQANGAELCIAGRVMAKREHGGCMFLDINDGSARTTVQALLREDGVGKDAFALAMETVDIGDFLEIVGLPIVTKRGERTIEASTWRMLAKSIRPLPEKWHGLQDVEERYRARHLDLLFNDEIKQKFLTRFRILELAQLFFRDRGYLHVQTPMLQTIPGGATARPFATHMHDLDMELYLRVAPELYLKRLLVGGFERVFELGKNFRNEGMDREHNPEFTMLEAYAAYEDHEWLMNLTEDFFLYLAQQLFGKSEFQYQGRTIKLEKPFRRLTFAELVREASGLDYESSSLEELATRAKELGVVVEKTMTKAVIGDELYKKVLREKMIDPVFVTDHPLALSPLSKRREPDADTVARFQLIMGGFELTNGFAELNDPIDQRERFEAQQALRAEGDEEAQRFDEDYVEAMEYGMPPAAGIGIGMDRVCALFTDSRSLRDILLFPTMKSKI